MRCLLPLVLLAACAPEKPSLPPVAPRPVTVLSLKETDPVGPLLLTGSAASWKETDVAAEVAGRVGFIVEPATNLEGRWIENGEVRAKGEVLARIDERTYQIRLNGLVAQLDVAKQELKTAQTQLEKILPANLEAARAERKRAEAEYVRNKAAFDKGALPEFEVIKSVADRDVRAANYEQAEAAFDTKRAEIEAHKAGVKEAEQQVEDAKYDLERCTVYAPFRAEVSQVYIEAGGYANAGQAVARLVMMDPIKVDVGVSQERAAKLERGDRVGLFLPGHEEITPGSIYEKATAADADTRTFRVSIILRNRRTEGAFAPGDEKGKLPRIRDYLYLLRQNESDPNSPFWVEANRALCKDGDGYYIWADPSHRVSDRKPIPDVITLRKIRVTPGDVYRNYQGLYLARSLTDVGGLAHGTLVALDVPEGVKDGDNVVFVRPRWMLRPGELVGVLLGAAAPTPGLYLPLDAVRPIDDASGEIFLHVDGKAVRTPVKLGGRVGDLVRVEGDGLAAGAEVITDYIHFLQDGEKVKVAGRRELSQ